MIKFEFHVDVHPRFLENAFVELCHIAFRAFSSWVYGRQPDSSTAAQGSGVRRVVEGCRTFNWNSLEGASSMTIPVHALDGLGKYRDFCLHEQPGAEARQVSQIGKQLRQARIAAGYSRAQLARVLRLDCELLVAVENGYGDLSTAQSLFRQAQRLCSV